MKYTINLLSQNTLALLSLNQQVLETVAEHQNKMTKVGQKEQIKTKKANR